MTDLLKTEVAHRVTVLKVAIEHLEDGVRRNDIPLITSSRVACVSVGTWVQETNPVSVPPHGLPPVEPSVPEAAAVDAHVDRQDSQSPESNASGETELDELESVLLKDRDEGRTAPEVHTPFYLILAEEEERRFRCNHGVCKETSPHFLVCSVLAGFRG
ncbi:hypothetical protein A0H81_02088 [Grifola frondosa]|uniref:Uncharacterized protein n=1 Tax=Grifola frondosa TaxID=5627 RepID=A0A1C7MLM9_GRIFR|nr:hypothetical protein A0H81_02088 [Grifola frondosa]